jgi:hypothetical protein
VDLFSNPDWGGYFYPMTWTKKSWCRLATRLSFLMRISSDLMDKIVRNGPFSLSSATPAKKIHQSEVVRLAR